VHGPLQARTLEIIDIARLYGYSQSGFDLITYIDAVLPLAKQENGQPIFDGFVVSTSFNQPTTINQCAPAPSGSGAGQIKNADVPIIRIASNSEPVIASVRAARRPDSDQPQDRFREYEVAGAAHASQNELDFGPAYLDIIAAGAPMPPLMAGFGPRSPLNAAFANLDRWARYNVPPPPGALITFRDNVPVLDQFGNSSGGVRSSYLDVPNARWFYASPGPGLNFLIGYVAPFDTQHLQPLYNSHQDYVGKVINDTRMLVNDRYLLREDADEIVSNAMHSDVPTLPDIPSDIPDDLQ
jgi:alpha/beta hydrolase family protein